MKQLFWKVLESRIFHVVGLSACLIATLAGCATADEKAKQALAESQIATIKAGGTIVAPVSQHEAISTAMSNCAAAIKDIAISAAGDSTSKVVAVSSIERLCGAQGHSLMAMQPQRAEAPQSLGATLWQAGLQAADILLRGYGIKSNRDVAMNASNNAAATSIASYGAFTNIASAGFASNGQIASYIQAPAANITLSGTGVIGSGSYVGPVNRNCQGGNGAAGNGASGTATIPGVPGAPANGGAANC